MTINGFLKLSLTLIDESIDWIIWRKRVLEENAFKSLELPPLQTDWLITTGLFVTKYVSTLYQSLKKSSLKILFVKCLSIITYLRNVFNVSYIGLETNILIRRILGYNINKIKLKYDVLYLAKRVLPHSNVKSQLF